MKTGLYTGQSGFYTKPDSDAVLDFFSNIANKFSNTAKNVNISGESKYSKQLKERNPKYFPQEKTTTTAKKLQPKTSTNTTKPVTKTEATKPVGKTKPATQSTSKPTPQSTSKPANNTSSKPQTTTKTVETKSTTKPSSSTEVKRTYLKPKPKGEVNMKVKLFQEMLLNEGLDLGKAGADGMWGPKTQEAFEKLQANKANYAIAMEKFNQMEAALQPKRIESNIQPVQLNSRPTVQPRQEFPTLQSAYLKKGGLVPKKEKGNQAKKLLPGTLSGDEIITDEVYKDMNPAFWKDHQNELAAKRLAPTKKQKPNTNLIPEKKDKPELTTDKYNKKAKGGLMKPKKKKCACGCAMKISKNAKGGLIESCACGCKTKK